MNQENKTAKWLIQSIYPRFEGLISVGIIILVGVITIAAFWGLLVETGHLIIQGAFESLDHKAFQSVFGMIMTLLIALEFNSTILHRLMNRDHEVVVRTVILVSILAVSRHFVVTDMEHISSFTWVALALSILSLGVVYWLLGIKSAANQESSN
jgi:uncharacterized membrane protein (DUF373 family)